jgi:hypothetical protein
MQLASFTNEDLEIVGRVFSELVESDKARTGKQEAGVCVAAWKIASAAEGVPFEAFDKIKAYYDTTGVYHHVSRGVVAIGKPETQEAEFTF